MSTQEQMALGLEPDQELSPEAEALADGRLSVEVIPRTGYGRAWSGHVRAGEVVKHVGPFSTVHVFSRSAGGEIRGYVLINGLLYLRTPAYPREWDALDLAVSERLSAPVVTQEIGR